MRTSNVARLAVAGLLLTTAATAAHAAAPPDSVVIQAVTNAMANGSFKTFACSSPGDLKFNNTNVIKRGDFDASEKWWPYRVQATGVCQPTLAWMKPTSFDGTGAFAVKKNAFGEWVAIELGLPRVSTGPIASSNTSPPLNTQPVTPQLSSTPAAAGTQRWTYFCTDERPTGEFNACSREVYSFAVPWNGRNLDKDAQPSEDSNRFAQLLAPYKTKADAVCRNQGFAKASDAWPLTAFMLSWQRTCKVYTQASVPGLASNPAQELAAAAAERKCRDLSGADYIHCLSKEMSGPAVGSPPEAVLQGFRIEEDAVSGEPAIARGAEEWQVVLPKQLSIALAKAAPGFRIFAPTVFANKGYGVESPGIRAASNALTVDFDGDGKSDLIVVGTVDGTPTAIAALSNRGQWNIQALRVANVAGHNIERHLRYFAKGTNLPDGTGRKSPGPGFSFFDDDNGGDLLFVAHGKWVRAISVRN